MNSLETVNPGGGGVSRENTPEGHTGAHKSSFSQCKQVNVRNKIINDLQQPMLSYYVIYFEKFRKVTQRTEKYN